MTFTQIHFLFWFLFIAIISLTNADYRPDQAQDEFNLVEQLRKSKPRFNVPSDVTELFIFFDLKQILETDEKNGLLTAKFTSWMMYTTQTSAWYPENFGGTEFLSVEPGVMWAPDITLMEAVEVLHEYEHKDTLSHIGTVRTKYVQRTVRLSCHFDVTLFPFDKQECHVTFATPLGFTNITNVELKTIVDEAHLDFFIDNDYWELLPPVKLETRPLVKVEGGRKFLSSAFSASITFKRRPKFYLVVVILPNLVIYLLSSMVFFVPVESGEKVSYIVTIFLAEIVNVGAMASIFPASSNGFPLLGYFAIAVNLHLSLLCVVTIAVVNFHFFADDKKTNKVVDWIVSSRIVRYLDLDKRQPKNSTTDNDAIQNSTVDDSEYIKKLSEFELREKKKTSEINRRLSKVLFRLQNDIEVHETFVPWKIFAEVLDTIFFIIHVVCTIWTIMFFFKQF